MLIESQRKTTWVQLFPNHDHQRGRGVAHVVMRNFAALYNQLSTQWALENVKGTLRLRAVVNIPQFILMCRIAMQIHH